MFSLGRKLSSSSCTSTSSTSSIAGTTPNTTSAVFNKHKINISNEINIGTKCEPFKKALVIKKTNSIHHTNNTMDPVMIASNPLNPKFPSSIDSLFVEHQEFKAFVREYFGRLISSSETFWHENLSIIKEGKANDIVNDENSRGGSLNQRETFKDDPSSASLLEKLSDHIIEMMSRIDSRMAEASDQGKSRLDIGNTIFICGMVFLDRLPPGILSRKNVFSLVGVAMGTAMKVVFDKPPTNKKLASIAKIGDLKRYNAMEARFCVLLKFNFQLSDELLACKKADLSWR